jgi:uncharacterized protein YjbI with pentapeptide repeats
MARKFKNSALRESLSRRRRKAQIHRLKNLPSRIWRWAGAQFYNSSVPFSSLMLTACVIVSMFVYYLNPAFRKDFVSGVFIEFNGMIFDILLFGIITGLFLNFTEDRRELHRQQEIIDDYKKWDSDEAKLRIAGAIRRINRLGRENIDFGGLELSNFSFRNHDIRDLSGSVFYDGTWGEMGSRDRVRLTSVAFDGVDCSNVVFSKFHPLIGLSVSWAFASLEDCTFTQSILSGAVFNGAHLTWAETPPQELGEWIDHSDGGHSFLQTHYPPFHDAELTGASFKDCVFKNADFRGALGLDDCDFTGAKGLEHGIFDDEDVKAQVLTKTRGPNARLGPVDNFT